MNRLIRLSLIIILTGIASDPFGWFNHSWAGKTGGHGQDPGARDGKYLGPQVCAACHAETAKKYQHAGMSKALEGVSICRILSAHQTLSYRDGRYSYLIRREGDQSVYEVTDGRDKLSFSILYCFGQGRSGQTYVFKHKGSFYESRLSFYTEINGLDLTIGYSADPPPSLIEAAGRRLSMDETQSCFGCHSTAAVQGRELKLDQLIPGVTCESCHGPGGNHVAAIRAGKPAAGTIDSLTSLDADDLTQNMCGKCHRSVEDVVALTNTNPLNNVRFQPYRMFKSRCYSTDRRIGCIACHKPHEPMAEGSRIYDDKCLACHLPDKNTAATDERNSPPCPIARQDCVSCHMPRIDAPQAHFKFTDHRIRIVRNGDTFPH